MAKIHTGATGVVSSTTTNGAATALYTLVERAIAAGWSLVRWSNGTTITVGVGSFSIAAISFANSWVQFQEPGGLGRQYLIRHVQNGGGTTTNFFTQGWYSPRAGFTGGTGAVVPTAADQQVLESGGAVGVWTPGVQLRINVCAEDTPTNGVYSLVMHCYSLGTTTQAGVFVHDAVVSGSYDGSDPEPCFSYLGTSWGSSTIKFHTGWGTGSQVQATMTAATAQLDADGAHAVDPTSLKDVARRYRVYSSTVGKGDAYRVLLKGQARAYPNNGNQVTDAYTYVGGASAGVLFSSPNGLDLVV